MHPEKWSKLELSEWLDKTQRESWQLELILSGFVIFLLLAGLEPYHDLGDKLDQVSRDNNYLAFLTLPYHTMRAAYYVLTSATIFHVFLRGLWISTIGLRSVSGDIDWGQFKMAPRFGIYLKKQVPSFDSYIQRIENYCSISFAFTFLMVFSILAAGSFLIGVVFIQLITRSLAGSSIFSGTEGIGMDDITTSIYLLFGLIYLIDFVSLGQVKRLRWFSRIYYPVYRFFGFVTFASFYRPIYYNLIDHRLGKRLALMILPFSLMMIVFMSLRYYNDSYIPPNPSDTSSSWYLHDSYEDIEGSSANRNRPSINAQVITDNHVRLFVPYLPSSHDGAITHLCPDLEPGYFTGLKLRGGIAAGDISNPDADAVELLECMKQLWRVTVDDSLYRDVNFRFYSHPSRNQNGLLSIIPIHELDHSEHYIKIDRQRMVNDSLQWYEGRNLWFYKE